MRTAWIIGLIMAALLLRPLPPRRAKLKASASAPAWEPSSPDRSVPSSVE